MTSQPTTRAFIHRRIQTPGQFEQANPSLQLWFLERLVGRPDLWADFGYRDDDDVRAAYDALDAQIRIRP